MSTSKPNVAVAVFTPDASYTSMADEVADGSVADAVRAVHGALDRFDTDGEVPEVKAGPDFDDMLKTAVTYAADTDGDDLLVFVTDGQADDPEGAEQAIRTLVADGNFVLVVVVDNQRDEHAGTSSWLDQLDADEETPDGYTNGVDVQEVPSIDTTEVEAWLAGNVHATV